ncbi:MAG: FAD-dependent oxidoreductase, partial [Desulfofustis sp.]|nr:FAD-dependent oxidoreductase [Desulfofustis sp.]
LQPTLQTKKRPELLIAGQLSGVEGYVESTAMGLLAGINAARLASRRKPVIPPPDTAIGALVTHLSMTQPELFQPSNVNFGLFPAWDKKVAKRLRGHLRAERSEIALAEWLNSWQEHLSSWGP